MEIWKEVPGFSGYVISSRGRIRSLDRVVMKRNHPGLPAVPHRRVGRLMVQEIMKGYRRVQLRRDGSTHRLMVHRLVLLAFVGPPTGRADCRHLNGVRSDNREKNLAWGTRKENDADKDVHETRSKGSMHGMSKLTAFDVRKIRSLLKEGRSLTNIASRFPVCASTIGWIRRGKTWRHV